MRMQCRNYIGDTRGAVTVFVVTMFAFLAALSGLVFDVGRIFNIHSQAQAYVDEVALASAAELDGTTGAIQRAIRAATGDTQRDALLEPGFRLGLGDDDNVNIASLVFLSAIDDDPAPGTRSPVAGDTVLCTVTAGQTALDAGCTADDDASAAFVLVNATTETEDFLLFPIARAFSPGLMTQASVAPQALAGFTREVCNIPPMAICNPDEAATGGGDFTADPGQQILLQAQGSGSTWAPGNFGFLDLTGLGDNECSGGGGNYLRCILGLVNPNTQCISADVDFAPGNTNSADVGMNVRFDIYDSPLHDEADNASFASDLNVLKGQMIDNCKTTPASSDDTPETEPLPNDIGIDVDHRIGVGVTQEQLIGYWSANHNGAALPDGITTRYEAYQYEINNGMVVDKSAIDGENANPTCSVSPKSDRRRIVVAAVNCIQYNVTGNENDVPVVKFLEMFLTNYVNPDDHYVYAEVISVVEPGGNDGVLHEFPVLYR